jgi:hypothetical protein
MEFCNSSLLRWLQEVVGYQVAAHTIIDRCSEGWPLVPTEDPGPREDLYDGFEFHPPLTWDSFDPISGGGGDPKLSQQSTKPTSGDQSFSPEGFHLLNISVHLLALCVSQGEYSSSSSLLLTSWSCYYCCSSVGAPWAAGLPCTTSSILKGSSSRDACYGESCCGSCGCGMS